MRDATAAKSEIVDLWINRLLQLLLMPLAGFGIFDVRATEVGALRGDAMSDLVTTRRVRLSVRINEEKHK